MPSPGRKAGIAKKSGASVLWLSAALVLALAAVFGVSYAAVEAAKEHYLTNGAMTDRSGNPAHTGALEAAAGLFALPAMPMETLANAEPASRATPRRR